MNKLRIEDFFDDEAEQGEESFSYDSEMEEYSEGEELGSSNTEEEYDVNSYASDHFESDKENFNNNSEDEIVDLRSPIKTPERKTKPSKTKEAIRAPKAAKTPKRKISKRELEAEERLQHQRTETVQVNLLMFSLQAVFNRIAETYGWFDPKALKRFAKQMEKEDNLYVTPIRYVKKKPSESSSPQKEDMPPLEGENESSNLNDDIPASEFHPESNPPQEPEESQEVLSDSIENQDVEPPSSPSFDLESKETEDQNSEIETNEKKFKRLRKFANRKSIAPELDDLLSLSEGESDLDQEEISPSIPDNNDVSLSLEEDDDTSLPLEDEIPVESQLDNPNEVEKESKDETIDFESMEDFLDVISEMEEVAETLKRLSISEEDLSDLNGSQVDEDAEETKESLEEVQSIDKEEEKDEEEEKEDKKEVEEKDKEESEEEKERELLEETSPEAIEDLSGDDEKEPQCTSPPPSSSSPSSLSSSLKENEIVRESLDTLMTRLSSQMTSNSEDEYQSEDNKEEEPKTTTDLKEEQEENVQREETFDDVKEKELPTLEDDKITNHPEDIYYHPDDLSEEEEYEGEYEEGMESEDEEDEPNYEEQLILSQLEELNLFSAPSEQKESIVPEVTESPFLETPTETIATLSPVPFPKEIISIEESDNEEDEVNEDEETNMDGESDSEEVEDLIDNNDESEDSSSDSDSSGESEDSSSSSESEASDDNDDLEDLLEDLSITDDSKSLKSSASRSLNSKKSVASQDKENFKPNRIVSAPVAIPRQTPKVVAKKIPYPFTKSENPKSKSKEVPTTPKAFKSQRDELTKQLYRKLNGTVFENKLPADLQIDWSVHLKTTAGKTFLKRIGSQYHARIQLSTKVLDTAAKLEQTLCHEMCHAAAWLVNHVLKPPHGPYFRYWASRAMGVHRHLKIMTCHNYEINYKYKYECVKCGKVFGRHSKSIDTSMSSCPCGGTLQLEQKLNKDGSVRERKATGFSLFVKERFASVKKENPNAPHKELMSILSSEWKERKAKV